jgi:hypothetical protein
MNETPNSATNYYFKIICYGIISTLIILSLGIFFMGNRNDLIRYTAVQEVISTRLTSLIKIPDILKMAARGSHLSPGNQELANCLLDDSLCTVTNAANQMGFVLSKSLLIDSKILAGTTENPARYSKEGEIGCISDNCEGWNVIISFWATCPNSVTKCKKAASVNVRFQINPTSNFKTGKIIGSNPPNNLFTNKTKFAVSTKVR